MVVSHLAKQLCNLAGARVVFFFINNRSDIVFNIKLIQGSTLCGFLLISSAARKHSQTCPVFIPLTMYFGSYPDNLFASHVHDYYKSTHSLVSLLS